jgi:cytochrome c553
MSERCVKVLGAIAAAGVVGVGFALAGFALAGFAGVGFAASQSPDRPPDVARGAVIAAHGAGPGVLACAQCHAVNGASNGSGAFPRLAGQSDTYLAQQLQAFASGARNNAVMTLISKALSPRDAADVAAYYASVQAPFLPLRPVDPALFKRGEQLAKVGDESKQLQSCDNCHGPGGVGEPPAIPYLAGQYRQYIAAQLHMWRRGFRKTSPDAMAVVAKKLDDHDIDAVAAYFEQSRSSQSASTQTKQ